MLCLREARKPIHLKELFGSATYLLLKGHISRDCTAPNGGPLNTTGKVCYKCGQAGHISRDCTSLEANGQVDGLGDTQMQSVVPTAAVV